MTHTPCKLLLAVTLIFVCAATHAVFGQAAKINALSVTPSNVVEELVKYKIENPQATAEEMVKKGNELLDKQGFNYAFVIDPNTCQALAQTRKQQTDPKKPLNLTARLDSVAGERTNLVLPDEKYEAAECGRCFVFLPVWEVTEKDFVMFVRGINVKFHLPLGFQLDEVALVDNQNPASVVRRWKIPSRLTAAPLSVSDDGKILYLAPPQKELSDLAMMVFAEEGVLQFYERKNLDADKKGSLLPTPPKDAPTLAAGGGKFSYAVFESGGVKQTLRFVAPCGESK